MHYLANLHNNRVSSSADLTIWLSSSLNAAAFLCIVFTSHKKDFKHLEHKHIVCVDSHSQIINKPVVSTVQSLLDCSQVNRIRNETVIIPVLFNIDGLLEFLSNR